MRAIVNVEKDAALGKLNQEKEMRIIVEFERDALRAMMATTENEKVVLLGMKALEWIDEYRQTMIDMGVPPSSRESFSY